MIRLFSDRLAVLSIPYIHEMCFHVAFFSSSVLGTQRPFQSLKSCPSAMRNFLDFFIDDLCFSETPFICILRLLCPLMLFSLFFVSLSIYSTFWIRPQLYLSTHRDLIYIIFKFKKMFVCIL